MGLSEDMQRQQAAFDAASKQREVAAETQSRRLRDEASQRSKFLADFVAEARSRGLQPAPIPLLYYSPPGSAHQKEKKSSVSGWVVYLWTNGMPKYAIGIDGVLYNTEPAQKSGWGMSRKPNPVTEVYFESVPWEQLTWVLLGHPPARQPANQY